MRKTRGNKFSKKKRILLIAANPTDTHVLQIPKEFHDIKNIIKAAKKRDLFDIEQTEATQFDDLRQELLDFKPHIVHFSGHGVTNGILLEDEQGKTQTASTRILAELINLSNEGNTIECVILNACDSQVSAEAIHNHVPYAIGMNAPVGDKAAIGFAKGFYASIVQGLGYERAYQLAKNGFRHADENQRSTNASQLSKNTKNTQITSPQLFKKPENQQNVHYPNHRNEEQTNKTPWFYHTIDHDQLSAIDLFNRDDHLIFGHFIAKGSEAPESFVKHCYIEMLGGSCGAEEDIDQSYHHIKLEGMAKSSFENGLYKKSKTELLQPAQNPINNQTQEKQESIRHWLMDERNIVVLYIPLTKEQQQRINPIIQGAIDTLTALNLGHLKVLTLFRGNTRLPKKRWRFFAKKLPSCCLEMKALEPRLTEDHIYDWIPQIKELGIDSQQCDHMKEKLIQKLRGKPVNYEEVLNYLRDIQYPRNSTAARSISQYR